MLEGWNPEVKQAANDFLARRTLGEVAQPLGGNYAAWEVTKADKFLSPYIGKIYPDAFTEVMSMGMQYLQESALNFARDDPDMFEFVTSVLRGVIP